MDIAEWNRDMAMRNNERNWKWAQKFYEIAREEVERMAAEQAEQQVCGMALAVAEALSEQIDMEMGGPEDGRHEWSCLVDYGNGLYGVCWLGGGVETFDSASEWESFKTRAGE